MNWEKYIRQLVWLFRERPRLAWSLLFSFVGVSGMLLYRRRLVTLRSHPLTFLLNGTLAPGSSVSSSQLRRPVGSASSSTLSSSSSSASATAAGLRDLLLLIRQRAVEHGALSPLTTKEIIDLTEHTVPFRINVIDRTVQDKKGRLPSTSTSSAWPPRDAFVTIDPHLHITDITVPKPYPASLPHQGYSLLLNKYPVSLDHMVLITKEFISQTTPLTIEDLAVWFKCVTEYQALGFFNGGFKSGASQPRKHMQLVPLRSISVTSTVPYRTPIDTLIYAVLANQQPYPYAIESNRILTIPEFTFPHGFVMLGGDILRMSPIEAGKYLVTLYVALLRHCSMAKLYQVASQLASSTVPLTPSKEILTPEQDYTSHNVLLTKDYLMVVPRQLETYTGTNLSINALGYAGYFLTNKDDKVTIDLLRNKGSLEALKVCATGNA